MSRKKSYRYFMCDFETTVYEGQTDTEVWASASVELYTEDVVITHSIAEQFEYFKALDSDIIAYYHNLKFDGSFWLSYLMTELHFEQASNKLKSDNPFAIEWKKEREMYNNTFKYSISDKGQWYTITIKVNDHIIEIRDSLKLLPFSVAKIGKSFGTKHKKLEMEYKGYRYAGCEITPEEKKYIANDVLVVKEALEIMFNEGHDKLTIGSCCLSEYKKIIQSNNSVMKLGAEWDDMFPDVYEYALDEKKHRYPTVGDYIRKSYKGGWCYLVKGKEAKVYGKGTTADVNSLYPSMMHSESGNRYPVGAPHFWLGDYIPDVALEDDKYFFVRVKTRFYIKENYLPFIQIKGNYLYKGTEALESSDVFDKTTGMYYTHYRDKDGNLCDTRVELTLTMTDYYLMLEHYELVDFEIIDGCWFNSMIGIFDDYINHYAEIKKTSKGAKRESAKLFLNNLYGKMASSKDSSFKVAYVKEDESIGFVQVEAYDKKAGYIPVGSAITSYARNFTIRAAQKNYHGVDKAGFIYADTDSIHCDLPPEEVVGINVHPVNFCCWKLEACWDRAIFVRQKTYIEHVTHEDLEPVEHPYNNIKCAGMPQRCKDLFDLSMSDEDVSRETLTPEQEAFLFDSNGNRVHNDLKDFKIGLTVTGKLRPVRIKGGILLVETTYKMR